MSQREEARERLQEFERTICNLLVQAMPEADETSVRSLATAFLQQYGELAANVRVLTLAEKLEAMTTAHLQSRTFRAWIDGDEAMLFNRIERLRAEVTQLAPGLLIKAGQEYSLVAPYEPAGN